MRWWIASAKRWADGCGIALPFTTHRSMEVGSTKLRLRLASSLVNAWEDEGLGISPHCAAKPEPGIAASTATNSQSGGGSPESKRASSLITQSSGHGTSAMETILKADPVKVKAEMESDKQERAKKRKA